MNSGVNVRKSQTGMTTAARPPEISVKRVQGLRGGARDLLHLLPVVL